MSIREKFEAWAVSFGLKTQRAVLRPEDYNMISTTYTWDGYQAGYLQGLEDAARVCDSADKSTHPADLADAIRALKGEG